MERLHSMLWYDSFIKMEHGTEALEHIFAGGKNLLYYLIKKFYVFDINGTSLSHETIEYLRTWPSEDDFKEAICIGYSEAMSFAEYLQIDNWTAPSMQQLIHCDEHSSDD
ncbi:unnamed protein product [Rhizophagus irregularis]|nr:unnamed protein product [Rhizophagus irregularis]